MRTKKTEAGRNKESETMRSLLLYHDQSHKKKCCVDGAPIYEEVNDEEDAADVDANKVGHDEEGNDSYSNDENDDAIEQVKSSVEGDKAMEYLANERETLKGQKLQTKGVP